MRNRRANRFLAAILGGLLVAQVGCIGSFRLTGSLLSWNKQLSNKFVNELVFLGLTVMPVYFFSLMGDAFIFNTIEFWGGSNPISSTVEGGDAVASTRTFEQGELKVVLERPGIFLEILVWSKLGLIDKYRHDDQISMRPGHIDTRAVPRVQGAHRRHQAYRLTAGPLPPKVHPELFYRFYCLHRGSDSNHE